MLRLTNNAHGHVLPTACEVAATGAVAARWYLYLDYRHFYFSHIHTLP